MAEEIEIKVKSIKKTIDVLNCFVEKQPLGVTEISEKLGLYKSNVYNILSTLTAMDYLSKDDTTGKYYLGIGIVRLNRAIGNRYSFHNIAVIHMKALAQEEEEIVYLTVPLQDQAYYLDAAFPTDSAPFLANSIRNPTASMNCTGSGKAMLAYMPEDAVEEYLQKPLMSQTIHTITDADALRQELARIRFRGYATDYMESSVGISCVAVPILSKGKIVLGALSISGPSPRFTPERIAQLAEKLKIHVAEIQNNM
ncbi:MAG: IclR family transcriptional regulator [Oscillospiraceae bacterium]